MTADSERTSFGSNDESSSNDLNVFAFRETRRDFPFPTYASARKPSYFNSKSQSGSVKASARRPRSMGWNCGVTIQDCKRLGQRHDEKGEFSRTLPRAFQSDHTA